MRVARAQLTLFKLPQEGGEARVHCLGRVEGCRRDLEDVVEQRKLSLVEKRGSPGVEKRCDEWEAKSKFGLLTPPSQAAALVKVFHLPA